MISSAVFVFDNNNTRFSILNIYDDNKSIIVSGCNDNINNTTTNTRKTQAFTVNKCCIIS